MVTKKFTNDFKKSGEKTGKGDVRLTKTGGIKVGQICELHITALGPNNIGIDEYSFGYSVLVPKAQLGEKIKAKIVKIVSSLNKKSKYAIAQKVSSTTAATTPAVTTSVTAGNILTVNIEKTNFKGAGIVKMADNYSIIVPNLKEQSTSELRNVQILITKVKTKYAFAKLVNTLGNKKDSLNLNQLAVSKANNEISKGSKMTLRLPERKQKTKNFSNFFILKLNKTEINSGSNKNFVFIKKGLNAKPGDLVRIQILNKFIVNPTKAGGSIIAIAKIVQLNPVAKAKKLQLVEKDVRQMIQNGLHFGDKALKCNAQMKKYIWNKKTNLDQAKLSKVGFTSGTSDWNSSLKNLNATGLFAKNKKSNLSKTNNILNVLKTRRCLNKALNAIGKYAIKGRTFLFIGTKKPAAALVSKASLLTKNSFFVNTKWLGGMLTNWKTILKSISKIRPILKEKQKIIKDILQKRQSIKTRLIQKAFLLRNKSKLILKKGRSLISILKSNSKEKNKVIYQKLTAKLGQTQSNLRKKNQSLIEKRQLLLEKRKKLMLQSLSLKEKAFILLNSYKNVFNDLTVTKQKLRELQFLLSLTNLINNSNKSVYTIFANMAEFNGNPSSFVLPKEILNIITQFAKSFNSQVDKKVQAKATGTTNNILVINKVLSKLTQFIINVKPAINQLFKQLVDKTKQLQIQVQNIKQAIKSVKGSLVKCLDIKKQIVNELKIIKNILTSEKVFARLLKKKIKQLVSQKRFIQFLPKLRYLPISQAKITETVQILMKKIVDPKLKYPIDSIYNQVLNTKLRTNSKKVLFDRKKKWQRLEKYFGGIAKVLESTAKISLNGSSKNNKIVAVLIGQQEEMNAVRECQKLGIKMIHIIDSNCNPTLADHIIPANDDSRSSIKYVLSKILTRIRMGQKLSTSLKRFNVNKKQKNFGSMNRKRFNKPTRKFNKAK